jgi:hypothetical protein
VNTRLMVLVVIPTVTSNGVRYKAKLSYKAIPSIPVCFVTDFLKNLIDNFTFGQKAIKWL